jgi:ABC-type multidrug transport system ATPase subunit
MAAQCMIPCLLAPIIRKSEGCEAWAGGQRKRVNVGMELVKGPRILFLDEPTSGLDSSTSIALMDTLGSLSTLGMTVIATIHQVRTTLRR